LSKGGHGGARPGAGRKKGSRDAATKEHLATIAELARTHTQTAVDALVDVAKNGSDAARVAASNSILDRAYGKPVQALEHSNPDGSMQTINADKLTLAERKAILEALVLDDEPSTDQS
jgi:hypothetical protein